MLKYALCLVLVLIPLQAAAQEQVVTSTGSVPIRFSPPSPWLLGFPGWEVAQTVADEQYEVLRTLEIRAFSSKQTWAEVELRRKATVGDPKSGWVYWGESLADSGNFAVNHEDEAPSAKQQ